MTHHIPGAGVQPVPPISVSRPSLVGPAITTARLSREAIRLGIALRHESLAELNPVQFGNHSPAPVIRGTASQSPSLARGGQDHGFQTGRGLEDEMVAACEAAAATVAPRCLHVHDRSRWDRATWDRYLDAATRLEAGYGPRMRRLRGDIARLERLLELPIAA